MAKKMTDQQREILRTAMAGITKEVDWYYNEVIGHRGQGPFADEKSTKKYFRGIQKTIEERFLCHAKDVVETILGWEKGNDTEKRNRYIKLTNQIAIVNGYSHDTVHQMFVDASKYFLLEDYDHPMDAFLSRKEQRSARKRRKAESKYGPREKGPKVAKSDDEKKKASRLRRIKRKAQEEGITEEEFKTKYGYDENGLKTEAPEQTPKKSSSSRSKNTESSSKRKVSKSKGNAKKKSSSSKASSNAA